MSRLRTSLFTVTLLLGFAVAAHAERTGILLLAHGGNPQWNEQVRQLAAAVDGTKPTEIAFGMANRANIQAAVDRLRERGVDAIVAVPLFVSSWSSVITSTEYLLGARRDAPPELALFAKMDHSHGSGQGNASTHADHGEHAQTGDRTAGHAHASDAAPYGTAGQGGDPVAPIDCPVPIRMTAALNAHPVVADILLTRARSISRTPSSESVIIVAHGPTEDRENARWLADMAAIAERMGKAEAFASIDYLTLRDDAPEPVRDRATTELRELVARRREEGRRVLVVPLLVSYGGIERGLRQRLEGLDYSMPEAGLVPDDRLVDWVLAMADSR